MVKYTPCVGDCCCINNLRKIYLEYVMLNVMFYTRNLKQIGFLNRDKICSAVYIKSGKDVCFFN